MKIKLIDPENESIYAALGITEERKDELMMLIQEDLIQCSKEESSKITDTLDRVTSYCVHPNETAFVCYTLGAYFEFLKMRKSHVGQFIRSLFGDS